MSNPSDQLAQKPSFKWEAQRILILDKDDQFRFMARTMFQRQRTNEVLSTASMAEAVLHLMASPVNACLVGVAENEPAGIEFLRWLRDKKASPCPDVPVTALTESKDPAFIHKICRFGIEGLLRKPVSQEGLTRRVSQMILEPKRMVIAPGYLGPDRRNGENGEAFSGQDRRRPSEPVFTGDRPKPAVVLTAAKPQPPKALPPSPPPLTVASSRPPLTVASSRPPPPPVAAKPATPPPTAVQPALPPIAAKPLPPPPVPMAAPAQPASPGTPPAAVAARPATPASPVAPVYKPSANGAKLDLGEPAPTPTAQAGTKLAMDAAPATPRPAVVAAPSAAAPPQAAPVSVSPSPEKPKAKPAKLTFDLNGVLDGHRNWVLSRGTEGGRAALSRQNMTGVDLSGAILTQADLTYCRLTGAECSEAKLDGADLRYAEMAGADLTEAILGAARLRHVNLAGAKLKGANLRGADLSGADLRDADLEGAQMHGATLLDTLISDTDLSTAEGLTQAQINKAKRSMKTKLPPGLRLNLGGEEAVVVAEAS
ncbi:MAG: pentapeptide repeat-containing protein [Rhodospirillales bacterium]|nr:pentapeptide repeat-containing protein [Rhodospirillales bacterium]